MQAGKDSNLFFGEALRLAQQRSSGEKLFSLHLFRRLV